MTKRTLICRSFVICDGAARPLEELPSAQRRTLVTALKADWLNALFAGRAVFSPSQDDKTQDVSN